MCQGVILLELRSFVNALPAILFLKLFKRARVVFYLGDIPSVTLPNRCASAFMKLMANEIIVNSKAVQEGISRLGIPLNRIAVIYNGVSLPKYTNAEPIRFKERFNWPSSAIVIGFAGQLSSNKGAHDFLDAATVALAQNENCRFVLIGKVDENDAAYLGLMDSITSRGLGSKIVFSGWVSKMESAYAGLDIVVVPSRHAEPAANINIEGMASGIPVIATRVGGSPELIIHDETGLLVDPRSPDQLAEAMLRLASDSSLRARLGAAGRKRVRENFDASKNALQVERQICGSTD